MDRVFVIKGSVRCFTLGCVSLFPVLGLVPAIVAIIIYKQVQIEAEKDWNPARGYLLWGIALSWLGFALSTGVLALAFLTISRNMLP